MSRARALLKDTLLLTAVSLALRTAGVWFSAWLSARLGTVGVGVIQLLMTSYNFCVTLASAGVRLAAMRLVAESGHGALRFCLLWGCGAGLLSGAGLFSLSGVIADGWLDVPEAAPALRILSASLPFLAMGSALGGYFTASRQILCQASVHLVEQAVQLVLTMFLLPLWGTQGLAGGCAAVTAAMTLSEIASCGFAAILARACIRRGRSSVRPQRMAYRFLRIALPDAAGSLIGSLLRTAQGLLIVPGLRRFGLESDEAVASYGVIGGMVLPVLLYPSALLLSLAGLLVPELAAALARGQSRRITDIASTVLHWASLFSFCAAGLAFACPQEIAMLVYQSADTAPLMRLFAPLLPLLYLDIVVDGMLKGLDQQLFSMTYNLLDSAIGVILVLTLVPRFGLAGYIATMFVCRSFNALLSLFRLTRAGAVRLHLWHTVLAPLLCALSAGAASRLLTDSSAPVLLGGYLLSYLLLLLLFGAIRRREFDRMLHLIFDVSPRKNSSRHDNLPSVRAS